MSNEVKQPERQEWYESNLSKRHQPGTILGNRTRTASARKITRPRIYDLYDIFCVTMYVLKKSCTWRGLPRDFPKWNIVYHYYQMWSVAEKNREASLFERMLGKLASSERVMRGRDVKTSMIIMDSQSVKNTETAEGDDGEKNIRDKCSPWR
jgi:transposase